ncbi:CDP-diacylglycerol--glycerol-3-phosphate 3-phosphatidyltransferase [Leptospira kanakyensis]|uniref:CDP-diacylglycerol--glycerol-3-phosphate 3-phosphatidyltransferase n=1 Tax=Leptospira kanakyensis TaxID=2484968 RepID=UPI00223D6F93|nr:CDP-diacylglycerol--glycerol-3-phosphate 3-phosphatidyltransferase [Leptospira kanakyensis]MCW7481497.1 CDP-diacylglycerol--glycerol-3-phosphate 3-phosphatidyltransferase [Leptospira kanakyensis]
MEDWKTIANIPNLLTVLRVLALPFFIFALFQKEWEYQIFAFVLFALASLTDLVDGYLARKWNQQTEFGKFLDPLADKFLVIGCFVTFLFIHEPIEVWMVVLIISRDMLITFLRYIAVRSGKSLRTTMMGKVKTAFQMGAILMILVVFMLISGKRRAMINETYAMGKLAGYSTFEVAAQHANEFCKLVKTTENLSFKDFFDSIASFVPYFGMLFTTFITVISGLRYIATNYQLLTFSNLKRIFYDRANS